MSGIILYHYPGSAPSRGAVLTARALNLDIEIKIIDLFAKEQLKPDFIKINPQHCIPTLDDNGFILWESKAIEMYLCQAYGGAKGAELYPQNLKEKAIVDQRLNFDSGTLLPRIRAICHPILFSGCTVVPQDRKDSVAEAFGFLDIYLEGNKWLAGNNLTIADCATVPCVSNIQQVGFDITPYKNVVAWFDRCKENMPGFQENLEAAKAYGAYLRSKLENGQF